MVLTTPFLYDILFLIRPTGRSNKGENMSLNDTYDKILAIAGPLFSRQGYTATSMRQIAAESGIGKATIYHHFPNKQAIVSALLERNTSGSLNLLESVKAESDPRLRIRIATQNSLTFFYESADLLQIVRREIPELRPMLMSKYADFFKSYTALLRESISQGIEQGIFRPTDPAKVVRILMSMIQGTFVLTFLNSERPLPAEEVAAPLLDVFFHGIEKA